MSNYAEGINEYRSHKGYSRMYSLCKEFVPEIKQKLAGRKVVIWGCGLCGAASFAVLLEAGIAVTGFADKRYAELKNLVRFL